LRTVHLSTIRGLSSVRRIEPQNCVTLRTNTVRARHASRAGLRGAFTGGPGTEPGSLGDVGFSARGSALLP
jgi:hypothetical protein